MNTLNKEQINAVLYEGNILISAGAGTGKTTVLIHKLLHIISQRMFDIDNILTVTFTNKAASEIKERMGNKLSIQIKWIGTFHNICTRILRYNAKLLNIENFTIIDMKEQISFLKQFTSNPKEMLESILYNKEKLSPIDEIYFYEYQKYLKMNNKMDFADLMIKTVELFAQNPEILDIYQKKFKIILVDEYQDTNFIQYKLIKMLGNKSEICCVGDEDQSIYEWRGANSDNFRKFIEDFNPKIIKLQNNYRSTQNILDIALNLIKYNKNRIEDKTLIAQNDKKGQIIVKNFPNPYAEAKYIAKILAYDRYDTTILVRLTSQINILTKALQELSIPYHVQGSMNLYEREEIKNIIAFLKLVEKNDNDSFIRIINVPKKGIGKATIEKLYTINEDLVIACSQSDKIELKDFYNHLISWRSRKKRLDILAREIITEIKYLDIISNREYIDEFLEQIKDLNNISELYSLKRVNIMTIHAAKGLEFDTVFISMSEGILPMNQSNIEEERRLAYTAITRAKNKLYILSCNTYLSSNKLIETQESRFLSEMKLTNLVYHQKFKYGKVISTSKDTMTVDFPSYGRKIILKKFLVY